MPRSRTVTQPLPQRVVMAVAPIAMALIAVVLATVIRNRVVAPPASTLAAVPVAEGEPGPIARSGSIHLPRGGPYHIGAWSSARFRITIGTQVIEGDPGKEKRVVITRRVLLPAGIAPIRVSGSADVRLLWLPPGRRGEPEYLPGSVLSGQAPTQAVFEEDAGAETVDAAIAIGIGCVFLMLTAYYLRHRWKRVTPIGALAVGSVFAIALAVRLYDLGGAGQTFDEDVNWSAGRNYVQNLLSLDFSEQAWRWNLEHPPVTKYVAGVGALLADGYGPARALSALAMACACALLALCVTRLCGRRVGWLAGVIAALSPHLVAHGKVVGHEALACLFWMAGLWLALSIHDGHGKEPRDLVALSTRLRLRLVGLGVVVGLALASRFIGGLLLPLVLLVVVVGAPPEKRRVAAGWALLIVPLIAGLTLILLWPRLWTDPVIHMQEAWSRLGRLHSAEPFLGALTNRPPMSYFLVYLVATAPVLLLCGCALFFVRIAAVSRSEDRRREWFAAGIVIAWFCLPLVVMFSPVRQDGVRYVLPTVMAMSAMASIGIDGLARIIGKWAPLEALGFPLLAAGVVFYLASTLARIHPYYLDYYGEHMGGPAKVAAASKLETAWWGEGLDRAIGYVNDHARPSARVYRECVAPVQHLGWFRGDLWEDVRDIRTAEWIVDYEPVRPGTAGACPVPDDAKEVYRVSAMGAPLAIVYKRNVETTP